MFVSMKERLPSLIHLFPSEASTCVDVLQPLHEGVESLRVSGARGELFEPFAKSCVERSSLGLGDEPGAFDEVFVGAEGDIFHAKKVYTRIVFLI